MPHLVAFGVWSSVGVVLSDIPRIQGLSAGECFCLLLSVGCQLSGMTSVGSDSGLSQMSVTCITRQSRFKHILQHWDGEVAAPFETAA